MLSNLLQRYKSSALRHYQSVVAFAVVGAIIGGLVTLRIEQVVYRHTLDTTSNEQSTPTEPIIHGPILREAEPTRLRIPAVSLDTRFFGAIGLAANQELDIPEDYDEVGWYQYGPTPGELGPAVVLGHVDSYQGPAVFFNLGQLSVGDEIYVDRLDGSTAVFAVTELDRPAQAAFPTEKVYGNLNHAGLRLITCTGVYDHGVQRYSHNLIVFAKLVREE